MTIEEFIAKLDGIAKQYPAESEKALKSGADRMRRELRQKWSTSTNIFHPRSGKISKSWRVEMEFGGADSVAKISNKAKHYHLIERGHRVVTPKKRRYVKFQPGIFFTKETVQAKSDDIKTEMAKRLYRIIKGNKL